MAQAAGNQFSDMMESDHSFETILTSFGITQRTTNRLTEDYVTANDLMVSKVEQIKSVVNLQNKMNSSHATALHCCYINAVQLNRILAFYNQIVYEIMDAHDEYNENNYAAFDCSVVELQYTIQLCRINVAAMERSSMAPVHLVLQINNRFDMFNV